MTNYPEIAHHYHSGYSDPAEVVAMTTSTLGRLVVDATSNGALSGQFKKLIAFAIAITARYDDCTVHHSHVVIKPGVTRPEAIEMIGVEFLMECGPSMLRDVEAVRTDDKFARIKQWNLTARVLMCFEIKNPIEL